MANTISISALRQELWSKELLDDVMRDVGNIFQFMGEGADNIIQVSRELGKKKGDAETFGLVARLAGDGVTGDDELEGNEEAMLSYSEQVAIDQIRNAVRLKGKLDAQKVVYDQIKEARENLRVWMKEFLARQIMLKLGGVTDHNGQIVGHVVLDLDVRVDHHLHSLNQAAYEVGRIEGLEGRGGATKSELDKERLRFLVRRGAVLDLEGRQASLEAQIERNRADAAELDTAIAAAQLDLGRTVIRAPYAGRIVDRDVEEGARVAPGTVLFELVDVSRVEIPVALPASRYGEIAVGAVASVRVGTDVEPRRGAIARVGGLVFDGSLRTQLSQLRANLTKGS